MMGIINAAGGVMNASEVLIDAYAGATPLSLFSVGKIIDYDLIVAPYGNLWNFFLGTIPGAMAETSTLAILISYLWLSFRKVIKWSTPVIYIGTVFVLSWFIGSLNGESGVWFPLYSILSGGLMFGAVFMATEPVTSPRNPLGKIVYALFLGVLTVLFRYIGVYPEGVATAIIVMNIFVMPIDNVTAIIRSTGLKKKSVMKVAFLGALLLAIIVLTLVKGSKLYSSMISMLPFIGGIF